MFFCVVVEHVVRVEGEVSTQDAWRGPEASGGSPDFPGERMREREKVDAHMSRPVSTPLPHHADSLERFPFPCTKNCVG